MQGLLGCCISAITPRGPPLPSGQTYHYSHHHRSDLGNQHTLKARSRPTYLPMSESDTCMDQQQQQQHLATADMIASTTLSQYASLPVAPQPGKHTVLASFALHDSRTSRVQLLSLGAGVKCLPAHRLPRRGDALHDSHAEVIARRGAIRWLLEEVQRNARARGQRARAQDDEEEGEGKGSRSRSGSESAGAEADADAWVCARADGLYALRDDVQLWMYASTVPCACVRSFHPHPHSHRTHHSTSTCHRTSHLISSHIVCLSQVETRPWDCSPPPKTPKYPRAWTPSRALTCPQTHLLGAEKATHGSARCGPNRGARMRHACSAWPAATRSRGGACSAYRVRSRAGCSHRCTSMRSCLAG